MYVGHEIKEYYGRRRDARREGKPEKAVTSMCNMEVGGRAVGEMRGQARRRGVGGIGEKNYEEAE